MHDGKEERKKERKKEGKKERKNERRTKWKFPHSIFSTVTRSNGTLGLRFT